MIKHERQAAWGKCVLDMCAEDARRFFLKSESYCNVDLPHYFDFSGLLSDVHGIIEDEGLSSLGGESRNYEKVNYRILSNKDGRYAWRPFELIHPVLYVSLVEQITTPDRWEQIRERFKKFQKEDAIQCLSIPFQAFATQNDMVAQIRNWWQGFEQQSIELSLEYDYMFHTDISNCYAAIYTHSIAWAMHGKSTAKKNRGSKRNRGNKRNQKEELIGNVIDRHIQDMRNGQTNGIPQGSALMDLICEIVLGYTDLKLTCRLKEEGIREYRILRYRDDYRIFVRSPQAGEAILKALTEVLIDLGLKLNPTKTTESHQVVADSLKPDKRAWLRGRQRDRNLQKYLLVIHAHGMDFPNSGSLNRALNRFHKKLDKKRWIKDDPGVLISIATDIACTSPRAFSVCAAIISNLLNLLDTDNERIDMVEKIHRKLSPLPNTEYMKIWLQRISYPREPGKEYNEKLCLLVKDEVVEIWENEWIENEKLKAAVDPSKIIDKDKLRDLNPVVSPRERKINTSNIYDW